MQRGLLEVAVRMHRQDTFYVGSLWSVNSRAVCLVHTCLTVEYTFTLIVKLALIIVKPQIGQITLARWRLKMKKKILIVI